MKIICDSCKTKYSIADEKVKGKVFKIRCKKCQNVIVVKGTEDGAVADGGAAGAAVAEGDAGGAAGAVWHLVIDREQVGPMTAEEVRARLARGDVDSDTYCWRDGFADWKRLAQVDELGGTPASAEGAGRDVGNDLFAPAGDDGAAASAPAGDDGSDLFASPGVAAPATSAPAASSFSASAADADDSDHGHDAPASRDLFGDGSASAGLPAGGAALNSNDRMTGQRNENSVLFSLNNLQALAMGGGGGGGGSRRESAQASAPAPGMATGSASGEGSGLIDLRAVAATLAADKVSHSSHSMGDDILPITAGPAFSPAIAAPVLMPSQSSETPKWLWPAVGGGGVILLGLVVTVIWLAVRPPPPMPVAPPSAGVITTGTGAAPAAGTPAGAAPAGTATGTPAAVPAAGTPGAAAAGTPGAAAPAAPGAAAGTPGAAPAAPPDGTAPAAPAGPKKVAVRRPGGGVRKAGAGKPAGAAAAKPAAEKGSAPNPTKAKNRKRDSLDDLLDDATK